MPPAVRIRPADASDAARLAAFAERTFRDTFAADNRASDMDLYCALSFSESTQAAEIADPSIDTLLAVDEGDTMVGYAQMRVGHAPAAVSVFMSGAQSIELARLYVERAHHGRGLAQRLVDALVATARGRGGHSLWLGVWERNERAQTFYRKVGFVDVGAHEFLLGTDRQIDRLMVKALV